MENYNKSYQLIVQAKNYTKGIEYVESNEIRLETSSTEYIRRQIYGLQKIRKKAEKYKNMEDIRGFFTPRS